jgi:hypothetical protein
MAVVVAVPLNALLLLGAWRYSILRLGTSSEPATAGSYDALFYSEKGAGNRKFPADGMGARSVVDAVIEDIVANANGPVGLQVGSDSFDVLVTLRDHGNLPPLPDVCPETGASSAVLRAIYPACTRTASNGAPRGRRL